MNSIEQLRALADGRIFAPESEQHPDAELLRACAEYLEICADAAAIEREARQQRSAYIGNPQFDAARERWKEKQREARRVLNRLVKTPALTGAGVFGKATIVVTRRGYMTAPGFMRSLASDLTSNLALRANLWPPETA